MRTVVFLVGLEISASITNVAEAFGYEFISVPNSASQFMAYVLIACIIMDIFEWIKGLFSE